MGRAPCCDKANVKKGPWAPEEDAKLKDYIHRHGTGGNWIALPQKAGLKRCGKSCRLRWLNYLRPNIKHGEFSEDEERIICSLFTRIGSRWSVMASQLPGRTDNDIKNYWNTKLKKKILMGMASYTQFDEKMPQKATNYTPLSPLKSQFSSSYSEFRDCDPNFLNFKSKASFSSSSTVNNGNNINHLVFGGEASCSPSDGNLCCLCNGDDDGTQETVMTSERGSSDEKATTSGLFGGNPLDKYDIKDIKQLISTNSICCNNLNFFVDEIMTEEKVFN